MTRIDGALISAVKYFRPASGTNADSLLSSVHYKLAFGVILACAILTGLTSWYSPIECMKPRGDEFELSYVKQWCYANSTFIVQGPGFNEGILPGIDNRFSNEGNRVVHIRYYQWITLALVIQASFFQLPHMLWKTIEARRVDEIVTELRGIDSINDEERDTQLEQVAERTSHLRSADGRQYFAWFIICQSLYFVNAVFQIAFTESFLGGQFISLMPGWLAGEPVLHAVFPKSVKCDLRSYGSSGGPNDQNVLCILAMNILNEKIYLLLWALMLLTLVISIAQLGYIILLTASSHLRNAMLLSNEFFDRGHFDLSEGEWLVLKFVKSSLNNSILFADFMEAYKRQSNKEPLRVQNVQNFDV